MDNKKIALITIDLETDPGRTNAVPMLFSKKEYFNKLCEIISKYDIPLSVFILMKDTHLLVDGLNKIKEKTKMPLKVGMHGFEHEPYKTNTQNLKKCIKKFKSLFPKQPLIYRAPYTLINKYELKNLINNNFSHDSSICPSLRFDKYKYNNLSLPTEPFFISHRGKKIIEIPIGTINILRLPLIFAYIKLLGINFYKIFINIFGLPNTVNIYLHPYDLYTDEVFKSQKGIKKYLHLRNSKKEFQVLEKLIILLKKRGYRFKLISDIKPNKNYLTIKLNDLK